MIKQIVLPLFGVAAFIVLVGLFVKNSGNIKIPGLTPEVPTLTKVDIKVGDKAVSVEVADTEAKRERGLSGRTSLDENSGMLFVFDSKHTVANFWMKGMLIPLDFLWIRDGKVIKIDKNIQPAATGTSDSDLKIYSPGQPIDYVLEMNAGYADKNGVKIETSVDLSNALK